MLRSSLRPDVGAFLATIADIDCAKMEQDCCDTPSALRIGQPATPRPDDTFLLWYPSEQDYLETHQAQPSFFLTTPRHIRSRIIIVDGLLSPEA